MKQFLAVIYLIILLFVGLNVEIQAQEKKETSNQIAGQAASVNYSCLTCYYNAFKSDAKLEIQQQFAQSVLSSFKKVPYAELFNEKIAELLRNQKTSKYLFFAKFQVIRFEGPDIIHPFNYFW